MSCNCEVHVDISVSFHRQMKHVSRMYGDKHASNSKNDARQKTRARVVGYRQPMEKESKEEDEERKAPSRRIRVHRLIAADLALIGGWLRLSFDRYSTHLDPCFCCAFFVTRLIRFSACLLAWRLLVVVDG